MRITFNRYAFRIFILHFLGVFACVATLVLCAEFIEIQRRSLCPSSLEALFMALLKTPSTLHQLFPLWVLTSALIVFMRLTQSNEFLTLSSTGSSTWQNLRPFLLCALALGLCNFLVLQPINIFSLRQYHLMEAAKCNKEPENVFHVFSSGIWIKQNIKNNRHV